MPIRFSHKASLTDDVEKQIADAMEKWANTKAPSDHAELMRLYELHSNYHAECGACIAGRALFMDGLNAMLAGDTATASSKIRGSFKSVYFKFDLMKAKLGL